jgi:hypothetical protein
MESKKTFRLVEVKDVITKRAFLDFPAKLYAGEPKWIRPLDQDIEKVFDPAQNKKFRKGDALRWLLMDGENVVGRVAAFHDQGSANKNKQPTGGMGFFDCINNKDAAYMLFDACRDWLKSHGMKAMDGPINFGERDSFWGCLVDGFHEPLYNMPYNFPYYQDLFESYGFRNYFNQYTYHRKIEKGGLSEEIREKARRVFNNPDYRFEIFSNRRIKSIAEDFTVIFNSAWARFPGVPKINAAHSMALLKQMKPIMDNRLIHIAYYKNEPVGFFIMMPDIFQIFRKFNGKLNLINKLRFIYNLRVNKNVTRIIGRIFGVVPEHQGKGVEGGLVMAFEKYANGPRFQYTDLELNWIGDFNPTMMKVCEQIGSKIYKTHATYRYLFDPEAKFERAGKVNI